VPYKFFNSNSTTTEQGTGVVMVGTPKVFDLQIIRYLHEDYDAM